MRSTTAGEDTVLQSSVFAVHLKVEIENAAGTYQDVGALHSKDWQHIVEVRQSVDQRTITATIELWRDDELGNSLSPWYSASPDVALGRGIRIYGSRDAHGTARASANWKLLLDGFIDYCQADHSPMTLEASDNLGGRIAQRWVKEEDEYGSEAGIAVETVCNSITTDWTSGISVYAPSAVGFLVSPAYRQQKMSVGDALTALALLPGNVIEPRWDDGTSQFRLTIYEPDRSGTTSVWTFGKDDYYDVTELSVAMAEIRNSAKVIFTKASTGERSFVEDTVAASVTAYGEQWMEFEFGEDSPIDTDAEAQTLLSAALSDLAEPDANHEVEVDFFWPVQLGDIQTYTANDIHYTSDQKLAVSAYRHRFANGTGKTYIRTRGKPTGGIATWRKAPVRRLTPFGTISPLITATNSLTASADGNEKVASWRILASKTGVPTEAEIQAETAINGRNLSASDIGDIEDVATGSALSYSPAETIYIGFQVYSEADGNGLKSPVLQWTGRPGDLDEDSDVGLDSLGFDADGHLIIGASGDPDDTTEIYVAGAAVTDTGDPGTLVTTTDATSSGTVLRVTSTAAFEVDNYVAADIGGADYWGQVTAINPGVSLTVTPSISGSVPSGRNVYWLGDGKISGSSGSVTLDGTTHTEVQADIGEMAFAKAVGRNANHSVGTSQLGRVAGGISRRRGDSQYRAPEGSLTATRVNTDEVRIQLDVEDPTKALTKDLEYQRRDGDDQSWDAAWSSTWDTETGTAGSSTTLQRLIDIADPYTAIRIQATYLDENGATKTKVITLDLGSVAYIPKTITISPAAFRPEEFGVTTGKFDTDATEGLVLGVNDTSDTLNVYFADVPAVLGTVLTNIAYRSAGQSAADQVDFIFRHRNTILSSSSTGDTSAVFTDHSDSLSHTVGTDDYVLELNMKSDGPTAFSAAVASTVLSYAAPSVKQTF